MVNLDIKGFKLKPFNIQAKEIMEYYLSFTKTEVSDYTFAQNFIWLSSSSGFYTIVNDTFCLFILSGGDIHMLLPPLGKRENINDAIIQCFDIMNTNNSSKYYSRIDYVCETFLQDFVNYLEEGTMIFEILQDYLVEKKLVDYVYNTDDLIDLKGNSYHTKRNEINKFRKVYENHKVEELVPNIHGKEIMNLLNRWIQNRIKYMPKEEMDSFLDGINLERDAIKRILKYYNELSLIGTVLFINEQLVGFTVGEKLLNNTASILIEKTDFDILGSAQFIFREFCKVLKAKYDCKYINVGDDMGFENLKKVKLSYRPTRLVPKYTIYQK